VIEIATPDFTSPQDVVSINRFPVSFRSYKMENGVELWLPRGISRMELNGCWRIYFTHAEGVCPDSVYDTGRNPLDSLKVAWHKLVSLYESHKSTLTLDKRPRNPGVVRDPLMDTGVTGVVVVRDSRDGRKAISVHARQSVDTHDERSAHRHWFCGSVSEFRYEEDPEYWQGRIERMICEAVAVRRYFNYLVSVGNRPSEILKYRDVPLEFRRQPYKVPNILLEDLFNSYSLPPDQVYGKMGRGGNQVQRAVELQNRDLRKPYPKTYLNGFSISLSPHEVDGETVYLPRALSRTPTGWMLRIRHRDGFFIDEYEDSPGQESAFDSLSGAWEYLISQYRNLECVRERSHVPSEPLLDTGMSSVN